MVETGPNGAPGAAQFHEGEFHQGEGEEKAMIRDELDKAVAVKLGYSKLAAHASVDAVIGAIAEAVAKGDEVRLEKFGTFAAATVAARTGRNPRTGEELEIGEKRKVKFKPAKQFKDAVANGAAAG